MGGKIMMRVQKVVICLSLVFYSLWLPLGQLVLRENLMTE